MTDNPGPDRSALAALDGLEVKVNELPSAGNAAAIRALVSEASDALEALRQQYDSPVLTTERSLAVPATPPPIAETATRRSRFRRPWKTQSQAG